MDVTVPSTYVAYRNTDPYRHSLALNETHQYNHSYSGSEANQGGSAFRNK